MIVDCNIGDREFDVTLVGTFGSSHTLNFSLTQLPVLANRVLQLFNMASGMSDVEIIDSNDDDQVADYTPIESKRGTKKYWKVENNVECTKYIKKQLKVISFHRLVLT